MDWSGIISSILNQLLLRNAKGTILSLVLGAITEGVIKVLSPILKELDVLKKTNLDGLAFYHYAALWLFLLNFKFFFKKEQFDPTIENALKGIELYKQQGASEWEVKQAYKTLTYNIIGQVHSQGNQQTQTTSTDVLGQGGNTPIQ